MIGTRVGTIRVRFLLGGIGERQGPITVRSTRAAELKARRAKGAIGRVRGYPFAAMVLQRQLPQAIGLIEKLLLRELER